MQDEIRPYHRKNLCHPPGKAMISDWINHAFCDILPSAKFPVPPFPLARAGKGGKQSELP